MKNLDPDRLITGHRKGDINIWDIRNGQLMNTLQGHTKLIECLVLLPTNRLASGSNDETIKVWNLANNQSVNTFVNYESLH